MPILSFGQSNYLFHVEQIFTSKFHFNPYLTSEFLIEVRISRIYYLRRFLPDFIDVSG